VPVLGSALARDAGRDVDTDDRDVETDDRDGGARASSHG
jgi:hypothetical protein